MRIVNVGSVNEERMAAFKHTSGRFAENAIEFASKAEKEKLYPVLHEAINGWVATAQDEALAIGKKIGFRSGLIVGGVVVAVVMTGGIIYALKEPKYEIEE